VRPTSDRLRETLFNILAPRIEGAVFADVCAGSGAVGIEALSRGAGHVTFIESTRSAATIIGENLDHCGIDAGYKIIDRDAVQALKYFAVENMRFDIVFFDPPYASEIHSSVMWQIAKNDLLLEDGIVIVEHRRDLLLLPNYNTLRPYRQVTQGESCLSFYRMESSGADETDNLEEESAT
jgi:16S rRNA (guanine(966)-N(2))-methyltransferase RsmD